MGEEAGGGDQGATGGRASAAAFHLSRPLLPSSKEMNYWGRRRDGLNTVENDQLADETGRRKRGGRAGGSEPSGRPPDPRWSIFFPWYPAHSLQVPMDRRQ